jgi:hypothetical protein
VQLGVLFRCIFARKEIVFILLSGPRSIARSCIHPESLSQQKKKKERKKGAIDRAAGFENKKSNNALLPCTCTSSLPPKPLALVDSTTAEPYRPGCTNKTLIQLSCLHLAPGQHKVNLPAGGLFSSQDTVSPTAPVTRVWIICDGLLQTPSAHSPPVNP